MIIIVTLLLALMQCDVLAQYARTPQDTVRLREVTTSTMTLTTSAGDVRMRGEHDAIIALAFGVADSAQAWYEALRLSMETPQGRLAPTTDAALRRPFHLRFDDRGRISTLSVPPFPASFEDVTDLAHQFDDLFLRLPAEPLALGLVWEDTAVTESKGADDATFRGERHFRSRVVRDTVVAGEDAWVIESRQSVSVTSAQRLEREQLVARTHMTGSDTGIFVFSKQRGRLLGRERSGTMMGTVTYQGGPRVVSFRVRHQYENRVSREP